MGASRAPQARESTDCHPDPAKRERDLRDYSNDHFVSGESHHVGEIVSEEAID
jgi:hypothetical protein